MNNVIKLLRPGLDQVYFGVSAEKDKNWFNHGIEWYTGEDYSHALAVYWDVNIQDFVVTNSHGVGVQLDSIEQFFEGSMFMRLFEVKVTPAQRVAFIKEAIRLDGTPYSKSNIGGLFIAKLVNAKLNPFADKEKALFCSEYTCKLSRAAQIKPACEVLNIGPEMVEPPHMVKSFEILSKTNERVGEIILPKIT